MYIAIEGIKGSGKSTLLAQLTEKLAQDQVKFVTFNPTRPMSSHVWWEQAYLDWQHDDAFRSALYTARANYHAAKTDFNHPFILGDRSILTSIVTRWQHNQHQLTAYIKHVKLQEYAVPLPDIVLYLDVSLEVVQKRLTQRQRNYGLQDETLLRLQQNKRAYQQLFKQKAKFGLENVQVQVFDADQSTEQLFNEVYSAVKTLLLAA